MSLIHWWPFNGNTRDKLDSAALSASGETYSTGKIGNYCLKSTKTLQTPITIEDLDPLNKSFTFSFWVKINEAEVRAQIETLTGEYNDPTGSLLGYNEYGGFALTWKANSRTSFSSVTIYGTIRGSSVPDGIGGYTLPFDTWTHVTLVNDASTQTISLYINGELNGSRDVSGFTYVEKADQYIAINSPTIAAGNGPRSILPCYLNDVRIYDHALSATEVELLAQGLIAHYPLRGAFLPNLIQGAEKYTETNPLTQKVSDTGQWRDSYIYYPEITVSIPESRTYIMTLKSDCVPYGHYPDVNTEGAKQNTTENRKYSMWLRRTDDDVGGHVNWSSYATGKDETQYGFFELAKGTYELRVNLYLQSTDYDDYTIHIWDLQMFESDTYCPEEYEPAGLRSSKSYSAKEVLNVPKMLSQDVSGYNRNATASSTIQVAGKSPQDVTCARFDGTGYLACGKEMKVVDGITVCAWAYMDDWANYAGKRVLSCTEGGGWNFEPTGDKSSGGIGFAIAVNKTNGDSPYTYFGARSSSPVSSLAAGWHFLCGTYDGYQVKFYLDDANPITTSVSSEHIPIYYNSSNGMFIGAEAAGNATVPQSGTYFNGKISDVRIYCSALTDNEVRRIYNGYNSINDGKTSIFATNYIETDGNLQLDKYYKAGNFSQIDAPLSNMKIKTLPDGTSWAKINSLDLTEDKTTFNTNEVASCDEYNRYSNTQFLDDFGIKVRGDYTVLEYIQSTGSEYINTGFIPSNNSGIELDFQRTDFVSSHGVECLFGTRKATTDSVFGMWIDPSRVCPHYGSVAFDTKPITTQTNTRMIYSFNKNNFYVGNQTGSFSEATFNSGYTLCLLTMHTADTVDDRRVIGRIYGCKIYDNGRMIRNYIPVKNSSGVCGLFDLVHYAFYRNSGPGAFTAGPSIGPLNNYEFMLTYPSIKKSLPKEYTELEYIEADGHQQINTKVTGGARWEFDIEFPQKLISIIPTMTSNSPPYGSIFLEEDTAISSQMKDSEKYRAYMAFDGNKDTGGDVCYGQGYGRGIKLGYIFDRPYTKITKIKLNAYVDSGGAIQEGYIQSLSGGTWTNRIYLNSFSFTNNKDNIYQVNWEGVSGIRVVIISTSNNLGMIIREMQAYTDTFELRQLMGYGGNGGEYWGVQPGGGYGIGASNPMAAKAGKRDTFVQDYSNGTATGNTLSVQECFMSAGSNLNSSQEYRFFNISNSVGVYSCFAKLYGCNCLQDNKLIRKFVPAKRNYDNKIGLYDMVENQFYTNELSNNVEFIPGPEVLQYSQLEYISSNKTQYIDTGVAYNFNNKYKLEATISFNETGAGMDQIMGATGNKGMGIGTESSQGNWWETNTYIDGKPHQPEKDAIYNIVWEKQGRVFKRTINGQVISTGSDGNATTTNNHNILLFAAYASNANESVGNTISYHCNIKLYQAKIYLNDVLVRDFIPVQWGPERVGLLDLVGNQFYDSGNSSVFEAGPPIVDYEGEIIEYVESDGSQYINTGFTVDSAADTDIFRIKAEVASSDTVNNQRNFMFGFNKSSHSHYAEFNEAGQFGAYLAYTPKSYLPNTKYNVEMKIEGKSKTTFSINNTVIETADYQSNEWGTFNLFRLDSTYIGNTIRIYGARMYYNNRLVRDYIPFKSKAGQIGMFDLIENKFYPSSGNAFETCLSQTDLLYQPVEYLYSSGPQYINTGFVPNQNTKIECAYMSDSTANDSHYVYGSGASYNSKAFELYPWTTTNSLTNVSRQAYQTNFGSKNSYLDTAYANKYIKTIRENAKFVVNNSKFDVGATNTSFACPGPLYLFALNRNNSPIIANGGLKIYYCKIYDGKTLVRDFIPVRLSRTNEYCMYDKVGRKFYRNAGSGSFSGGAEEINNLNYLYLYNRWKQINSPNSNYRQIQGYYPIHTDFTRWDGKKYDSGALTKSFDQDSSAYLINQSNDLWVPLCPIISGENYIRAADGSSQEQMELWVRFDGIQNSSIYSEENSTEYMSVAAPHFIEY